MNTADSVPDDIVALHAELAAERAARREAEARAIGAEAMVTHLKLVIAKLEHHRYGASSERGRKLLDQAELQLEELEADVAEAATVTDTGRAAIVGAISPQPGGVGGDKKSEGQPCGSPTGLAQHATLGAGLPSLRGKDSEREAVRIASNGQRPL